jgi:hypothetical protein
MHNSLYEEIRLQNASDITERIDFAKQSWAFPLAQPHNRTESLNQRDTPSIMRAMVIICLSDCWPQFRLQKILLGETEVLQGGATYKGMPPALLKREIWIILTAWTTTDFTG